MQFDKIELSQYWKKVEKQTFSYTSPYTTGILKGIHLCMPILEGLQLMNERH